MGQGGTAPRRPAVCSHAATRQRQLPVCIACNYSDKFMSAGKLVPHGKEDGGEAASSRVGGRMLHQANTDTHAVSLCAAAASQGQQQQPRYYCTALYPDASDAYGAPFAQRNPKPKDCSTRRGRGCLPQRAALPDSVTSTGLTRPGAPAAARVHPDQVCWSDVRHPAPVFDQRTMLVPDAPGSRDVPPAWLNNRTHPIRRNRLSARILPIPYIRTLFSCCMCRYGTQQTRLLPARSRLSSRCALPALHAPRPPLARPAAPQAPCSSCRTASLLRRTSW